MLIECFDPYVICFRLPNRQKFHLTPFNIHLMLGVPVKGRQVAEIAKSLIDEEYEEAYAT